MAASLARSQDRQRWLGAATLAVLGAALLWHLVQILAFGAWAMNYPYELDYGEGIVWQQMRLIFTDRAYGPIDGFPAIVFHYPPVYHAVTAAAAASLGIDELAAGRGVSLAGLMASIGFGGAMIFRLLRGSAGRFRAGVGAVVAALVMLSNWPVLFWTPVMRVDLLALAFSFGGAWCALRALERPAMIHAAAIAFVLAVYTKHSMIAAPAACFGILLLLRPRTALRGLATSVLLGLTALAALGWVTDGGFLRHLFLYNINRFELRQLEPLAALAGAHSLYFVAAGFALWGRLVALAAKLRGGGGLGAMRARILAEPGSDAFLMILAYLAATVLMLPLAAKSGSNVNYLIEFFCVLSLFVGIAASDAARLALDGSQNTPSGRRSLAIVLIAAIAAQAVMLPKERFEKLSPKAPQRELAALSGVIQKAGKPVISDDMVLLIRSGREVAWEPAIFAELSSLGRYDDRPFIRKIERGDFSFFITFRQRGEPTFDSRYNSEVADAIDRFYPAKRFLAGYTLHMPAR